MGRVGVPRYTQVPREYVQRIVAAAAAAAIGISDATPNGPVVHDATYYDALAGKDANDAAADDMVQPQQMMAPMV